MMEDWQNHSAFPHKQIRFEEIRGDEDRISRLPDCLLVEILSRLPDTKCAIKTSALSKRWKQVWTLVPNLIIIPDNYDLSVGYFSSVDKTLTQRGQLKLNKLTVDCTFSHQFEPQVRDWIRYAINCNVEEINIDFWNTYTMGSRLFLLDECFCMSSYFTDLKLSYCRFNPAGVISWEKLLSLHISNANLDEDLIENILSRSPVLETMKLKRCCGFRRLNITSKSVKKLVFDGYLYDGEVIEINAPTILSLEIKGYLFMRKVLLINVASLVEADLDYALCGDLEIGDKEDILKGFITNLRHVKEVKIGSFCSKFLSRLEAKGGFIVPSNMKVFYFNS